MAAWSLPVAAGAVAAACAALSPLVIARRWAFVGEGVSHSGYGGAGVIWLLSLLLPGIGFLHTAGGVTVGVAIFSICTALGIGKLTRERRLGFLGFDAATGIFLTASLAFGFLVRTIYEHQTHALPIEAEELLFGDVHGVDVSQVYLSVLIALVVLGGLWLCGKEVLAYAFDPELAQLGGVPAAAVHYGLLAAVAGVVVIGSRLVGVVLVTALLVLPGATAALLGGRLGRVYALSFIIALIAAAAAVGLYRWNSALPLGPMVVLGLVMEFLLGLAVVRLRGNQTA